MKPDASDTINGKLYPLNAAEWEVEKTYIEDRLRKGYLEECEGPYGHSTFYIAKKNGKLRPVVDYKPVNKYTVTDIMPLPQIPLIHDKMHGKKLFSKFDIQWGYNNIQIIEEDC